VLSSCTAWPGSPTTNASWPRCEEKSVTTHAVSRSSIVELTSRMSCVLKTRFGKVI